MERAIRLVTDVKDLSDLLKEATVDEARLSCSGGKLALELELTRAMIERKTLVRQGLFKRLKTPWTKCQLRLKGAESVTVKRLTDVSPDTIPLLSCEAVKGGYQLSVQAPDGVQFFLSLAQLEGSFADIGSPIESP